MARTYRGRRREEWRRDRSRHRDRSDLRLSKMERVPLNNLHAGVIVLADVPFREGNGHRPTDRKLRPALVVRRDGRNVALLPISTKHGPRTLLRMPEGLLPRPSYLQRRVIQLDRIAIREVIADPTADHRATLDPVLRTAAVTLGSRLESSSAQGTGDEPAPTLTAV